ncbi:ABC protein, subfamily ABCC [Daphnia pulex]|uniref:ABC-type xenobiotic transporter n=1 Tax=Daphnia pulex TaxID=6669 RepID=E9GD97_DAPPU|nr:ABC protein, subfamily ABCC [Daphnia pulex]|eukprot:EFX82733.1 ABC protein, subfamily ABCC [Daphnia pulex]
MDWNIVCGSPSLILWSNGNIGKCFGQLAFTLPSSVILTAVSSYYLGKEYNWVIRDRLQNTVLSLRAFICLFLAFIPLSNIIIKCYFKENMFMVDYLVSFVTTFSWLCHMLYIIILKQRVSRSLRGPLSSLAAWMLTVIPCAFQMREDFYEFDAKTIESTEFWLNISYTSLQFFYLLTLIPYGMANVTGFDRSFQSLADENLNQRRLLHYNRFDIDYDRFYLGIAREGVTFLSRLFMSWVQPLMKKGSRKQLNSPDDLFDLPRKTTSQIVAPRFERQMNETKSVVKSLHECFGSSFYLLGLLKFTGDALGFVGPLVLSALVQFIDNKTEPMIFGYFCAAALCIASFTAALCNVHFNFKVSEISLRMRIALISTIYNKTLRVSSADLSKFSSGEIVNMMSTDTDRIINFCPSFHAFWSLPLQVGVTLYLLYSQVGLAFLAGLTFAVMLIPINRWIAVKVGKYSGEMMAAKDKRVRLMNELLGGIRVVKFYAWEKHFRRRIKQLRADELKALKARKYLDALCVYFWATTPVLVAILTFATFVLMGGTLTSAKVFTCMALFNMLISPLNAFPWVIGGLVEAWVSLKRVRKLIQVSNHCNFISAKRNERCTGRVELNIISTYWKAVGIYVSPIVLAMLLFMQSTRNVSDWWLAHWVSELQNETINGTLVEAEDDYDPTFYLAVYGGIAAANTIFTFLRAFLFAYGGLKAATFLHSRLVDIVLRAKMVFFDTTPVGRILNRLSSDVYAIDESLPFVLNIFLAQVFGLVGTIVVTCVGIPWISLLLLPLGFIYFNLQHYYRHTSRELKRLSTVTLSPIYSRFAETLSGLVTIRATDNSAKRFAHENLDMVEDNVKTQFASQAAANWLGLRLQLIGVAMVTGVGIFAVVQHHLHTVDPGLVGLAISYALSVTSVLSGVVTSFVETEKEMVSVERVHNYIQRLPVETSASSRVSLPVSWPTEGRIVFQRVSMRYREHFPLAVRDVSFEIRPSEKVGIVGRTGSGKTTLFQILFRLVDICSGEVLIDGVNVQSLSLSDLRSRLAIIPQDPFIFSGTVRENLDPIGQYSDRQLWKSLERCHLRETVARWPIGLSTDVQERGRLFSVGQKQLLCLARALLLNSQVICIDEATASVDAETDRLIQKTIRSAFRHSTVLTIAHRLETIMDSDRVAVMSAGQLVEFDSPSKLLENPVSHFYQLVNG